VLALPYSKRTRATKEQVNILISKEESHVLDLIAQTLGVARAYIVREALVRELRRRCREFGIPWKAVA
jgi:hypothetical protein